jgi:hypothetical protein
MTARPSGIAGLSIADWLIILAAGLWLATCAT